MIILIVESEYDERSGNIRLVVSHGIDTHNDNIIPLPQEHPAFFGATLDLEIGEYVMPTYANR